MYMYCMSVYMHYMPIYVLYVCMYICTVCLYMYCMSIYMYCMSIYMYCMSIYVLHVYIYCMSIYIYALYVYLYVLHILCLSDQKDFEISTLLSLVFLELKARTPTLSFKDYSVSCHYGASVFSHPLHIIWKPFHAQDQVGMKNTTLGRIVKGLKLHNRAELAGAPPDMCLQAVMDKLTMTKKLSAGMKMNVKKLAIE